MTRSELQRLDARAESALAYFHKIWGAVNRASKAHLTVKCAALAFLDDPTPEREAKLKAAWGEADEAYRAARDFPAQVTI